MWHYFPIAARRIDTGRDVRKGAQKEKIYYLNFY